MAPQLGQQASTSVTWTSTLASSFVKSCTVVYFNQCGHKYCSLGRVMKAKSLPGFWPHDFYSKVDSYSSDTVRVVNA